MTGTHFDTGEFRTRTARLQRGMAARDLDALLLTGEADIRYVTGFLTRFWESPTRPWFVVVPAQGDPVAVIPTIGAALMGQTWITDIRSWPAPRPADDGVTLLADTLAQAVPQGGRVGLPMGPETHLRMPLADFHRVQRALPGRAWADATDVLHRVREVKSEAEIARIRAACGVADRAFARVPGFAGEGTPLDAVFRDFQIACLSEGADWVPYLAGGTGPGGYADVISPATAMPLVFGDVLMLDTGVIRDGYYADFDRNFSIGPPDDATRRAHATLFEATDAGLAAARPGATAADLFHAMHAVIARAGDAGAVGRLGHGLGSQLTEWPSLTPDDRTPLRAGMVLTLEPGLETGPGRMLVHEENIVLRDEGPELLSTRAPAELEVLT